MKSKNKIWKNTFESQLSWTKLREGSSCPNALLSIWYKINQYLENPECKAVCLFADCKTSVFFSKSVKKSVKPGAHQIWWAPGKAWSKSLTREAREPHMPHRRVKREKNRLSVFHTTSSFRPGGSKMSSSCQNSVHNSTLFVYLIH